MNQFFESIKWEQIRALLYIKEKNSSSESKRGV